MQDCNLIVVGTSMGGLTALEVLLANLPANFCTPIAVVMHRSVDSTEGLVGLLRKFSDLRIREPLDKEPIQPGHVYIAPPDYHLMIDGDAFALSTDAPELFARPCIDVLFETAAESYGSEVVAIVMTGASTDGARGAAAIQEAGGTVIVQDPESAESSTMPQAAIRATGTPFILTLGEIGGRLPILCGATNGSDNTAARNMSPAIG